MKHPFHAYPVHLYHAKLPPIIAQNAEDEAEAVKNGYTETYIAHEYPKMVNGVTVNSKAEEEALTAPAPVKSKK